MLGTPTILLSLSAVLSAGVLAFPTAQHDQILVHHTPTHDVVFIPDFMVGGDHHLQHPMSRRQHGVVHMDGGYARGHHSHHHEEPQRICLQQVGGAVEYPEQPQDQHIMLNPNHAVYISTQDEFGNLRTFKISSNNILLQQSMLTGQEISQKQDASEEQKADQEKIVEEIVAIEKAEEKASDEPEKVEGVEQPKETQIETPTEDTKEEIEEVTPKENAEEETPKENAEEETPKENVEEETPKENVEKETPTENAEEETPKENTEEETPKMETNEEVVTVEPESEHEETPADEANDDEDKASEEEAHSIEKRDVSSIETLDDVEKETKATEHISKEAEISKKDLSTSEEDKIDSSIEKVTDASLVDSVEKPPTSQELKNVERTNIQKIEKAITSHENVEIVTPKSHETVETTTEVPQIPKDLAPEAVNSSQESQNAAIQNQTLVVKQPEIVSEDAKVPEPSQEVVSKEISASEEKLEPETREEILTPVVTATPAPTPDRVLPVPREILATTPALPLLLAVSAEKIPEAQ